MSKRRDLLRHYQWLRRYGYNDSHSGNISVRTKDGFLVTPTGACADTLNEKDFLQCPISGGLPGGASLDARLHQSVYFKVDEAGALIHSHCPHAVALTIGGADYLPRDFEGQYYLPRIPVISIDYRRYVEQAAERVSDALQEFRVVIVRGHGVYARGKDLDEAYKWTCSLELSAKTAWLAQMAGKLKDAPPPAISVP
jgi:L-fuculose-phosphate aldolase